MRTITLAVLFKSLMMTLACCNPIDTPFRILLGVRAIDLPRANENTISFRIVVAGSRTHQTSVVTKFGQVPPILSEDGTRLTLLFCKFDSYLNHNGADLRVDTPITDLALAKVDEKTVAYLNDGIEIPINLAKMQKLRTIEVNYCIGCGTAQSPFWRGEVVTVFDVKRDARGIVTFGDGVSLGTCEGKATASALPSRPTGKYNANIPTRSPQPTNGNGSPIPDEEPGGRHPSGPLQPPNSPSPVLPNPAPPPTAVPAPPSMG